MLFVCSASRAQASARLRRMVLSPVDCWLSACATHSAAYCLKLSGLPIDGPRLVSARPGREQASKLWRGSVGIKAKPRAGVEEDDNCVRQATQLCTARVGVLAGQQEG